MPNGRGFSPRGRCPQPPAEALLELRSATSLNAGRLSSPQSNPGGEDFKDTVAVVPADAPALFIVAATDGQLGLPPESVALDQRWTAAHTAAELHIYAKGDHGFRMRNITCQPIIAATASPLGWSWKGG